MKKCKRLTATFLAAALMVTYLPSVTAEEFISVFDVMKASGAVSEVKAGEESPAEDFSYRVNADGESVTVTGYKGNGGDVVIPGEIEGKKVTQIGSRAFYNCTSLTSVEIPNSVTEIGDSAFSFCKSLTSVEIPYGVTRIEDDAFFYCTSLISVEIPNSVTEIGGSAFSSCSSLTSVEIPDSVTYIAYFVFSGCTSLTSVKIPGSVTHIANFAFSSCTSIASLEIPDSVTEIGSSAFHLCTSLTSINVDEKNASYSSSNGVLFNKDKTTLIQYPEGKTDKSYSISDNVTSMGESAFYHCTNLTNIIIPNSVTTIGSFAFAFCENLTNIKLPNSVTSIGESAFNGCTSLTNITIPNGVTSIEKSAFNGCSSLSNITIPNSVTSIGEEAFCYCSSLTDITIPNSVTSIGTSAFSWCSDLTFITIPNSVTSIGEMAFFYCISLTNITIPNSVTSIGNSTFSGCSNLTFITIPNSVTSIGALAFYGCSNLTDIYYGGSEDDWKRISIGYNNLPLSSATVHYYSFGPGLILFPFYSSIGEKENYLDIGWDWNIFNLPTTVYNSRLSAFGLTLSAAAEQSQSRVESIMKNTCGFDKTESNSYDELGLFSPGVTFGYKKITKNGKDQHIFVVAVRGTTGAGDIITDIASLKDGFAISTEHTAYDFGKFISSCGVTANDIKNGGKIFVTGHSLGGAVANRLSAKLSNEYGRDKIFGYTFASPKTVLFTLSQYNNIHNITNTEDGVTYLPPNKTTRYGQNYIPFYRNNLIDEGFYDYFKMLTGRDFNDDSAHAVEVYMSYVLTKANVHEKTGGSITYIRIACPVDAEVYNSSGELVGSVIGGEGKEISENVYVYVEGEEKYFIFTAQDDYKILIKGTDTGTMDYSVYEEALGDGKILSEKSFGNVSVTKDKQFVSYVSVWDKDDENIDDEKKIDVSDVSLYVTGEGGVPKKEVLPDGNGTEIPYLPVMLGDLNNDSKTTTVDAKWVLQAVSGSRKLTPEQEAAADVNGDGKITTVDAKWILQVVSGSRELE